jgi:N utilization substance protein A
MVRLKKLDQETLGLSSVMERITHARVLDCFKDSDVIYFVVAAGEMGKALGKGAMNVKILEREIGKRVRVIEHREKVEDFVRNVIYPLKVEEVVLQGDVVEIRDNDKKTKGLLIGRDSKNLEFINMVVKRFFSVDVKVI